MSLAVICAALSLAAWLYLVLLHGNFWLVREREEAHQPANQKLRDWPRVTAVVPARNEVDVIATSLRSLAAQDYPGAFSIVLIDDQSSDGTSQAARAVAQSAKRRISVIAGSPLPATWTGKVWAMQQGIAAARATEAPELLLLTDADIG